MQHLNMGCRSSKSLVIPVNNGKGHGGSVAKKESQTSVKPQHRKESNRSKESASRKRSQQEVDTPRELAAAVQAPIETNIAKLPSHEEPPVGCEISENSVVKDTKVDGEFSEIESAKQTSFHENDEENETKVQGCETPILGLETRDTTRALDTERTSVYQSGQLSKNTSQETAVDKAQVSAQRESVSENQSSNAKDHSNDKHSDSDIADKHSDVIAKERDNFEDSEIHNLLESDRVNESSIIENVNDPSSPNSLDNPEESNTANMSQLKLTKPAPEFRGTAVVNGDFKQISLSDFRGKYVVFFFYPLDFTFVCPTEIIAFSDRVEEFRSIGCEVIGCSTDSHYSHLAWVNTPRKQGGLGQMNIPLLADKTCEVAKAYGVYKEDEGVSFRGLFIIDDKGNLRQITVNDLPVGRSVDETLRLVQAFQFTDKHGEVCPAGWRPGKATMKPDPKESKTYFQSQS